MPRTVSQGFDEFLSRLTPLSSELLAATAHRVSVETALKRAMSVFVVRETGSFHHGTGIRHYSDIDLLVGINELQPTADTALKWVKDALSASFPATIVRINRPAVVVEFASGSETWEVIPGFIKSATPSSVYDIPSPSTGWIQTAPTEHLNYVNECNSKAGVEGGAKKLARLAKAWKYYCKVPISSFYLEMRAAQYMATQSSFSAVWDICMLLESLNCHQLDTMNDPRGRTGRFHPCSSDVKKIEALSKLDTAAVRARKALDAHKGNRYDESFLYLNLLFGNHFPSR